MKHTSEETKVMFDHEGDVNTIPMGRPLGEVSARGDQYLLS